MESTIKLIGIPERGRPAEAIEPLPEAALESMRFAADMYARKGYSPPWIGYLAILNESCEGTCAFKNRPVRNRVEIAYFTFPGFEGQGVATGMARKLTEIAFREVPGIRVTAQTLPEDSASTAVLRKTGFD